MWPVLLIITLPQHMSPSYQCNWVKIKAKRKNNAKTCRIKNYICFFFHPLTLLFSFFLSQPTTPLRRQTDRQAILCYEKRKFLLLLFAYHNFSARVLFFLFFLFEKAFGFHKHVLADTCAGVPRLAPLVLRSVLCEACFWYSTVQ